MIGLFEIMGCESSVHDWNRRRRLLRAQSVYAATTTDVLFRKNASFFILAPQVVAMHVPAAIRVWAGVRCWWDKPLEVPTVLRADASLAFVSILIALG